MKDAPEKRFYSGPVAVSCPETDPERAMTVTITPLARYFAAEVKGVNLTEPVADGDFAEVAEAFETHSILVFRNQPLDDEQQVAFSRRFGPLETTVNSNPGGAGTEVTILSNLDRDGSVIPPEDRRMVFNTGNQMWHTDSSFKQVPATASLLSARRVPPRGGETEFATMRAAYDALEADRRSEIDELVCVHDFAYSRGRIDPNLLRARDKSEVPPVRHPLVRGNPANGRRNLFTGAHASYVDGMPLAEGRLLIGELTAHATRPEFVYRHEWREGDLVMWDNRCALHRGRPWDARHARVMHRTTIAGVGPTL